MEFDVARIHRGEVVVAAGAAILLAVLFLVPWFRVAGAGSLGSIGSPHASLDGWQALTTTRWLLLLMIVVCGALVLLTAAMRAPAIPVALSMITCLLGGLCTLVLLFRVIDHPGLQARVGVYLGWLAALVIGYGGYLSLRTEASPFGDPALIETVSAGGKGTRSADSAGREESASAGRSGP